MKSIAEAHSIASPEKRPSMLPMLIIMLLVLTFIGAQVYLVMAEAWDN
jgi:hypothetical protein